MKNAISVGKTATSIIVAIATILLVAQVIAYAQPTTLNWLGPNGTLGSNLNYAPQNEITSKNINNLEVKWIFPVPSAPKLYAGSEGVIVTPSIVDGIVYFVTNYNLIVAADARDGSIVWTQTLPVLTFRGANLTSAHHHALWFTNQIRGQPLVWIFGSEYTIFAYNALTGDQVIKFNAFDPNSIPGNFGIYGTFGHNMAIDEGRGIIIIGSEGSEGTDSARGFFQGIDVNSNPPKTLWRTFIMPPQDKSDPNWVVNSVEGMAHAWIWNAVTRSAVDLKALSQTQLEDMVGNDWGDFGFNGTHSFTGVGTGWGGSWATDESSGTAYVATAQVGPDFNASNLRPGPNLWSASIMSLDTTTGKINWAFQTQPHDLWDFDCAWNVVLADATINGAVHKTVFKGCKNGFLYALDASTGSPFWSYYSPSIRSGGNGFNLKFNPLLDPTNKADMTLPWANYPDTGKVLFDATGVGNIESDTAFDPDNNIVISVSYNIPTEATIGPVKGPGVPYAEIGIVGSFGGFTKCNICVDNATVTALDANTGKAIWSSFIEGIPFRGGITISGGVVYVASLDGILRLYDEKTGTLLASKLVGGPMVIQPAIGADVNGDVKVIVPMSSSSGIFPVQSTPFPGAVVAFGLSPSAVTTVTSTAISTSVSTSVQTSVTTAVSTSVQTSVTTAVSTSVQTVQGPATGVSSEAFYGAIGAAVIFIIATGVLAMRRKKPAT